VLAAIDLDNELALPAGKISEITAYRKLPHKFMAVQSSAAQFHPKRCFRVVI